MQFNLKLFQSNRASVLAQTFCARNREADDPFAPLSIIVQNQALGRWLKFSLAQEHGVSANVECHFLAACLWQLYRQLPGMQVPEESPFDSDRLAWRIMALLEKNRIDAQTLRSYLEQPGDSSLRHYQLSYEIAGLFDRYLMYRPEWMLAWAGGGDDPAASAGQGWQPSLWRALLEDLGEAGELHRARFHQALLEQLDAGEYPVESLPRRLSVFGLSAMPALQLQTLQALSGHIEVDIYFLNPCRHYWGEITSDREQARHSLRTLGEGAAGTPGEDYLETGNPLLASLGGQGREYFEMLLDFPLLQTEEQFLEHEATSALALVKNDILELTFGGESGSGATPAPRKPPDQDSLQIHACHGPFREVEVLHDELLRLMDNRKDLLPGQILVLAPDLSVYAPFVHAVFGDSIPFSITERFVTEAAPVFDSFLTLLKLPEFRFTGEQVVELLDTPAIARRFGLSADDVRRGALWIRDTNIRWELDGAGKNRYWQVPPERSNTWEFGLERLLLGFAMTDENTWNGVLPFETAVEDAGMVASLARFVELLGSYRDELSQARAAEAWQTLLSRLLADFFLFDEDETLELDQLREAFEVFDSVTRDGDYRGALSSVLVHYWMEERLRSAAPRSRASFRGVQFARLSSLRGVPGRVVCLLGMNDKDFPGQERPHSFDLMSPRNRGRRRGDHSLRQDNRYLFLEALLAAEEVFYLSYVGRGIRDDKEKPPSVVVTEWLHYLQALFGAEGIVPVEHALQPYNRCYYQGGRLQSHQSPWYAARAKPGKPPAFCEQPLAEEPALACESLGQLERFFRNSAQYFLQQRLKVYFDRDEFEPRDTESFSLEALECHQLADSALEHLVQGAMPMDDWRRRQLDAGVVAPGSFAEIQLNDSVALARAIHAAIDREIQGPRRPKRGVVRLRDTSVQYRLDDVYQQTHLYYQAGELRKRQLLTAWLRHLALNADAAAFTTVIISKKKKDSKKGNRVAAGVHRLKPLGATDARECLESLLQLYHIGTRQPLFLPPEASHAYYNSYQKTNRNEEAPAAAATDDQQDAAAGRFAGYEEAIKAAVAEWQGGYKTEHKDAYWSRLFSLPGALDTEAQVMAFHDHATTLWKPLEACLEKGGR